MAQNLLNSAKAVLEKDYSNTILSQEIKEISNKQSTPKATRYRRRNET